MVASPIHIPRIKYQLPQSVSTPVLEIKLLTPRVTKDMNQEVASGKRLPYVYFGLAENSYITQSVWLNELLSYIKALKAVVEAYEAEIDEHNKKRIIKEGVYNDAISE